MQQHGTYKHDSFEIDFVDLIKLIMARKMMILLTMLLFVGVTFIVLQILPKHYMAEARISINHQANSLMVDKAALQQIASEAELLKSNKLALRVIAALGLYKDPYINAYALESDSQALDKLFTESDDKIIMANPLVALMLQEFSNKLSVSEVMGTDVIRLRFTHRDAQSAAQITNAIIDSYQSLKIEQAEGKILQGRQWLEEKLEELNGDIAASQQAVQILRDQKNIIGDADITLSTNNLTDLMREHNRLRLSYAETYAKIQEMRAYQRGGKQMSPDLTDSQILYNLKLSEQRLEDEISGLAQRYGDKHPVIIEARSRLADIKKAIRQEIDAAAQKLMRELDVVEAQMETIEAKIDTVKQSRSEEAGAIGSLSYLEQNLDVQQGIYQDYVQKLAAAEQQSALGGQNVEILSYATQPLKAAYPNYMLSIGLAGLMGIFGGFGLVLLLERLRNAFHSLPQLETETGLSVFGISPKINGLKSPQTADFILSSKGTRPAEMIRSIRTMLKIKHDTSPKVLMLTSSLPGEGKTTLSNWLGVLTARSGEKAIIIDCDFRRANLHKTFNHSHHKTLVDYLSNNASIEDVIIRDNPGGVHTIFGKDVPQQALDLIDSKRMKALIESLGKAYDLVILDAPTVHSVSDALLLSKMADHVLYCVAWNKTSRDVVQTGLKKFRDIGATQLDLVMTKVDLEQASHYEGYDLQYYAE